MEDLRRLAIAGLTLLTLAACGGGGGGDGGGDSGDGDPDRDIDLSGADGPYPLDDTDDVARLAFAIGATTKLLIRVGGDAGSEAAASAKASSTEACSDGGTVTDDTDSSPPSISSELVFDECQQGEIYTDGRLYFSCNLKASSGECDPLTFEFGANTTAFLLEVQAPAESAQRALLFGFADGSAEINSATQSLESLDLELLLEVSVAPLDGGEGTALGFSGYSLEVDATDDGDYLVDQAGTFLVDGGCGSGKATLETLELMRVSTASEAISAGTLSVESEADDDAATIVFDAAGTVTVTDSDGLSQTYTREQLAGLCSFD
ncbi:MAG: hypothetical protein K0U79_11780 [Gammaproteobacteria bacterium]|nr:hypothetical protein [Gammaproteobacteria bacterium]